MRNSLTINVCRYIRATTNTFRIKVPMKIIRPTAGASQSRQPLEPMSSLLSPHIEAEVPIAGILIEEEAEVPSEGILVEAERHPGDSEAREDILE